MKKIIYSYLVSCVFLLSSCSDYLNRLPLNGVSSDSEINTEQAIALTNAAYQPIQWMNLYNMRLWTLDIVAGNSIVGGDGGSDGIETTQFANFITTTDNQIALDIWRGANPGILRSNLVLEKVPDLDIPSSIKDRCLGEAYFLRAHYYFILVRMYGGVPLILTPPIPGKEIASSRTSADKIYEQIISDCENAITLLPEKSSYSDSDKGRACKEAALTMLAKVYLTLGRNYNDVVSICRQITTMGYDLNTCNYADNFDSDKKNNPESIFEVQYTGSSAYDFNGNDNQASWLSPFMGPRNSGFVAGSYGWNLPTEEFMTSYESGDLRKDMTVLYEGCPDFDGMVYLPSYSLTGYNVRKFLVSIKIVEARNQSPANFVVYRYADVLLMEAEALNELGRTTEAEAPLNKVRLRAGLPAVSNITQSEMKDTIIHERRIELAFEGHRWFDLIRIDNGDYALQFLKSIGKVNVNKNRLLLPIPQQEMDSNPMMTQNPGY